MSNPSTSTDVFSITFWDSNGTPFAPAATQNQSLPSWGSADYLISQILGSTFVGSGSISATSGSVAVAVEVLSSMGGSTDNVDTYSGVTTSGTVEYLPLGFYDQGYVSNVFIQNPGTASTSVTLNFLQYGNVLATTTFTVPAHGDHQFRTDDPSVQAALFGWVGPIQVTSALPVVAAQEYLGGGTYGISVAGPSVTGGFYVPRFDYNSSGGWNTMVVATNNGSTATKFTASFYNPDGSLAATVTSFQKNPQEDWILGLLPILGQDPQLPQGFGGSVIITNSSNNAVVPIVLEGYTSGQSFSALAAYPLSEAGPAGNWVYLPGLKNSVNGESSAFSMVNPSSQSQSYTVTYWGANGALIEQKTVTLPLQYSTWYLSQAADSQLAGLEVSAQISNVTPGGALPIVDVGLYSGSFTPPTSPNATPTTTPTSTFTPTSTATGTPTATTTGSPLPTGTTTGTPTITSTPTISGTPTQTGTATPTTVYGLAALGYSSYAGGTEGGIGFSLPLVRTTNSFDTIIHISNTTDSQTTATLAFYMPDGTLTMTNTVPLNARASFDFDVGVQVGTSFDGTALINSAPGGITATVDVLNGNGTTNDNLDTYNAISALSKNPLVSAANGFYGFNSTINVQNLTANTASVTLNFIVSPTPIATTVSIAPHGRQQVILKPQGLPTLWAGTVQLLSDQPISAVTEVTGNADYAVLASFTSAFNQTFYVPRFNDTVPPEGMNSAYVVQDIGTGPNTYTLSFYNPDGSSAATPLNLAANPSQVLIESPIYAGPSYAGLHAGFAGGLVATDNTGNASAIMMQIAWNGFHFNGLSAFPPASAAPSGGVLFLSALRANAGPESTAFTVMNTQSTAQSYTIVYYDQAGNQIKTDTVSNLAPNGTFYYNQATDRGLTPGEYSAAIVNDTPGGSLPVVEVDLYAGYPVPAPSAPTPTRTASATGTATPTSTATLGPGTPSLTPTPTITPIATDVYDPDNTIALAKPIVINGASQLRSFAVLGDQDWVSFTAGAGVTITFNAGSVCDTVMFLYDTTGTTVLQSDDDSGGGFGSALTYTFSNRGPYYLLVRNYISQLTNALWIDPLTSGQGQCGTYYLSANSSQLSTLTPTPTRTATATNTATPTATPFQPVSIPLNGMSEYAAGNDQSKNFELPMVRVDSGFDTVVHLANATSGATTVNVSFYDGSGNATIPPALHNLGMSPGKSIDVDVATLVAPGFNGSAIISASPNGLAVSADVVNLNASSDSLDSYAAVPGGAGTVYVVGAKPGAFLHYDSTVHIQNIGPSSASATIKFVGSPITPIPITIPAFGSAAPLDINTVTGLKTGWVGAIEITSNVPVAAVSETFDTGGTTPTSYEVAPMFTSLTGSTAYLPRFQSSRTCGWCTTLLLQNAGTVQTSFAMSFYNLDGTLAGSSNATVKPGETFVVGGLVGNLSLPDGFAGTAVVTNSGGLGAVIALDTYSPDGKTVTGIANFNVPTQAVSGSWAYLPGLRKSVGNASTAFTVLNTETQAQNYAISYWDYSGNFVRTDFLSLAPNQSWYADQLTDSGLPSGFAGSAKVANVSSGVSPPVQIQLFGGAFSPPAPTVGALPTPIGTVVIPSPTPATCSQTFTQGLDSTTVTNCNGLAVVTIPPNALSAKVGDQVTILITSQPFQPGANVGNARIFVDLKIQVFVNGVEVTQFPTSAPLTVQVSYDPAALAAAGFPERNLQIYLVDQTNHITLLNTSVDTVGHLVTAFVPHLTTVEVAAPKSMFVVPIVFGQYSITGTGR